MNNRSRIIIGGVFVVLFLVAVVAFESTQTNVTTSQLNNITKQNDTQIQNNSADTVEIESITIVKYNLNKDKSSKVNTKSIITDKSSKVNTKPNDITKNEVPYHNVTPFFDE